jgi:hypothetical protein
MYSTGYLQLPLIAKYQSELNVREYTASFSGGNYFQRKEVHSKIGKITYCTNIRQPAKGVVDTCLRSDRVVLGCETDISEEPSVSIFKIENLFTFI